MEIKKIHIKEFDKYYDMLEKHFCHEERKTREKENMAFLNEKFSPNFIFENEQVIGYVCYWNFESFVFIEHLAFSEQFRGKGYGTMFCEEFLRNSKKPVILEAEIPTDETTIRRIHFYENVGFVVNDYEYFQPSYHCGNDKLPMVVMSNKTKLNQETLNNFISTLKKEVYELEQ